MADDVDDFGYAMDNDVTGPHLVFAIKIQLLFSVGFFSCHRILSICLIVIGEFYSKK